MNLLKRWEFWFVVTLIVLVLLFAPLKACGINIIGKDGIPTGEIVKMYTSYSDYFTKGCLV